MARRDRTVSTRVRILAAILVVAAAGLAIAGGVTFAVQRERILAEVDQRLQSQVSAIRSVDAPSNDAGGGGASTATESLDPAEYASVRDFLYDAVARLVVGTNEASAGIVGGTAEYRSSNPDGFDISDDDELIARIVAETTRTGLAGMGTDQTDEGRVRYITVPVRVPDDPEHGIYVRAVNLNAELAPVAASVLTYSLVALATLAAIAVVGWFVVGRMLLSPIRSLQRTAGAISIGDLRQRVPTEGNDDMAEVGRTVNEMLDRLEGSVDVQRQLLDDVRHELKTPITIVRGHLEMVNPNDPQDVVSAVDIGISELDRMTRLVEDIDLLATVQDDEFTMGVVDIGALTERVGELVVVIPGHRWTVAERTNGRIRGNPDRLLQAWLALADNAAKYTPNGTPIEIGSSMRPEGYMIWVRDHGPGIPPAARHRIFRRFDRGGGRRDVGGSGLGLAIVDAIARAHGGSCTVTDTPGGGATFIIRIPARLGLGTAASTLPAPVRAGDVVQQREESG